MFEEPFTHVEATEVDTGDVVVNVLVQVGLTKFVVKDTDEGVSEYAKFEKIGVTVGADPPKRAVPEDAVTVRGALAMVNEAFTAGAAV